MDQSSASAVSTIAAAVGGMLTHVHTDDRRSIYESNHPEAGFSVQFFLVKKAIPLGNHYHAKPGKFEVFTILEGKGVLYTQAVDEDGKRIGEVCQQNVSEKSIVMIPTFLAHTFVLDPESVMHCFSSRAFDENEKDMHPLILIDPTTGDLVTS